MNRYVEQSVARILLGCLLFTLAGCSGLPPWQEKERPLSDLDRAGQRQRGSIRVPDLRPRTASILATGGRVFVRVVVENRGPGIADTPFSFEAIVVLNGQPASRQTFTKTLPRLGIGEAWTELMGPVTVPAMPRPLPVAVDVTVDPGAPRGRVIEQDERNNSAHYNLNYF